MEPDVDTCWDHLVEVLATIGDVTERQPRGLTVALAGEDGPPQVVDIDMTPDEWNDLTSIIGWHMDAGAQHVRQLVLDQPRAFPCLAYRDYTLTPAITDWERS